MEEVTKVDAARRLVHTGRRRHSYDYLIIASGSEYTYFGHDEWARHAPALKGLDDALEIRRRILLAFERAEIADSDAERRRLMTRSEEHTSELQSLMRISYAVFCLKKKNNMNNHYNKTVDYHKNRK